MKNGPLKLTQEIWCAKTQQIVLVAVSQAPGETDDQTIDRFKVEKAAAEDSCKV